MKITQGGAAGVAAQFEDAGITITPPADPAKPISEKTIAEPEKAEKPDDTAEDENGLTAADRAELTAKHLRAIGRKHAKLKEAEELAKTESEGRRSAEERAEALRKELEDLKAAAEKAKEPVRPKRDSFETQEAYDEALLTYGRAMDKFETEKKTAAERAQMEKARREAVEKAANDRIAHAREVVEDFDKVLRDADMNVPPHIASYMQESELFGELAYHFAKNPEDLERLAKLPTRSYREVARLGVEFEKIESKLQLFPTAKAGKSDPNGTQPSAKDNGESKTETSEAKPSTTATAPSRRPAPVITPLPTGAGSGTESAPRTQKEYVQNFGKREGVNLYARKRH
jgi:hypothetical protein